MGFSLCNTKVLYARSEILVYPGEVNNVKLINANRAYEKKQVKYLIC